MIPQQIIDTLKKVFSFVDDKLKVTNPDLSLSSNGNLKVVSIPEKATEQVFTSKSIAANSSEDFIVSNEYSAVIVTVRATYDAGATAGVRVRWLYSPDGSNFDSVEDAEDAGYYKDLTFAAGATRQRTVLISLIQKYTKVQIVNLDASKAVVVDVWKTLFR